MIKWLQYKYSQRQIQLEEKLDQWNSQKLLPMNLHWKVGKYGAWLELLHDTKEYGVYTDFANLRGFSADSDITPTKSICMFSPCENNKGVIKRLEGFKMLYKQDSWSGVSVSQQTPEKSKVHKKMANRNLQRIRLNSCVRVPEMERFSDISEKTDDKDSITEFPDFPKGNDCIDPKIKQKKERYVAKSATVVKKTELKLKRVSKESEDLNCY